VSFDIYLQAFENGAAAERDGAPIRGLLLDHADGLAADHEFARVTYSAGKADVYGVPGDGDACSALMFNHVEGAAFDLIIQVAQLSDLVVMPIGCPVCVVSERQVEHLPAELRDEGIEVVRSGRDLAAVIARS